MFGRGVDWNAASGFGTRKSVCDGREAIYAPLPVGQESHRIYSALRNVRGLNFRTGVESSLKYSLRRKPAYSCV